MCISISGKYCISFVSRAPNGNPRSTALKHGVVYWFANVIVLSKLSFQISILLPEPATGPFVKIRVFYGLHNCNRERVLKHTYQVPATFVNVIMQWEMHDAWNGILGSLQPPWTSKEFPISRNIAKFEHITLLVPKVYGYWVGVHVLI